MVYQLTLNHCFLLELLIQLNNSVQPLVHLLIVNVEFPEALGLIQVDFLLAVAAVVISHQFYLSPVLLYFISFNCKGYGGRYISYPYSAIFTSFRTALQFFSCSCMFLCRSGESFANDFALGPLFSAYLSISMQSLMDCLI